MRQPMKASFLALAALATLCACGRRHEVASGTFDDGKGGTGSYSVSKDSGGKSVTVKSAQGEAVIRSGSAAAAMPAGLALYPGASVTSSTLVNGDMNSDKGASAVVSFASADAPARIAAFYKDAAVKAGYKIDSEMAMNGMTLLGASRGEGAGFSLTVAPKGSGSEATLIAGSGNGPAPAKE